MATPQRLANIDWAAAVFTPLAVILMQAFWLYPWIAWVGKWESLVWQRPPLSLTSLVILPGAAYFATRLFMARKWNVRRVRLILVTSGLTAILVVVRAEYSAGFGILDGRWLVYATQALLDTFSHPHPLTIALLLGVYLWWRGTGWGHSPLCFEDIYHSFLIGLTALVVLILVWRAGSDADSLRSLASTVGVHVAGFFFFGLAALALGNLRDIQGQVKEKEGNSARFGSRWLIIIAGVVGIIVLLGTAGTAVFSADMVALLGQFLTRASDLLFTAFYYLLLPVGYLVAGSLYAARFIINWLRKGASPQSLETPGFSEFERQIQGATRSISPEAILVIKWVFFAIVIAAVIFVLARAVSRSWSSAMADDVEETHASLWSWEGFKADLHLLFSLLWRRLAHQSGRPSPGRRLRSRHPDQEVWGRLSIRDIYVHLLRETTGSEMARRSQETPYEYARRLGQAVPECNEQLNKLTELYIGVRYGDLEAGDEQVDYANSLWRVLQGTLERLEITRAG